MPRILTSINSRVAIVVLVGILIMMLGAYGLVVAFLLKVM